jgi:hypothetical protein
MLTHKLMPCMTVVSVEVSERAIRECCLVYEEDANAGSSSVDDRSSDIIRLENLPRSFSIQQTTTANVGMPCMIVVSVGVSDTAILEGCLLHEEYASAGPSSIDHQASDHTAGKPSTLLPYSEGHRS